MKLAVTDTSVFIDLFATDLLTVFFELPFEVLLTHLIYYELFEEQRQILDGFVASGKLTIYNFTEEDWANEKIFEFSRGLSNPDKSVLMYAHSIKATVLSGDMLIRKKAKLLGLEYHGILWVFDQLVYGGFLDSNSATIKLQSLIDHNLLYKNSKVMMKGLEDRILLWGQK